MLIDLPFLFVQMAISTRAGQLIQGGCKLSGMRKEYADMNWYRGKQTKHVKDKEMEMARTRSELDEW